MQQSVFLPIIVKGELQKTRTMQVNQRHQQDHTPSLPIIVEDNAEVPQQNEATILGCQSSARRYARAAQQLDSELPNVNPPRYSLIMAEGFQYSNMMNMRLGMIEPQVRDERLEHNISGIAPRLRGEPTHAIIQISIEIASNTDNRFVGLKVQAIDNGVFVRKVEKGSPADLAGLWFGDQILSIDRISVTGYSRQAVKELLRRIDRSTIPLEVRDRPYERSIIMQKDVPNCYGFRYLNGRILSIVKGSSAATEGLQYDQQITSINGKSVIGLNDTQLWNFINRNEDGVSISFVPHNIYKRITRKISLSRMLGSIKQTLLNI